MGLFGKLFEKKTCDICGEEIKLLGNRKLSDGNLCKACAAKLSPWFSERKQSTVEDIRGQLEYREKNREAVAAFNVTRALGRNMKVLIDEDASKFMVTSERNYAQTNPDVLDISQVTGCDFDIDEDRREEMHSVENSDGTSREVSYNPPRYTYDYDFYIIIHVNHPYFDEIRFKLNNSSVYIDSAGPIPGGRPAGARPAGGFGQGTNASIGGSFGNAIIQGIADAVTNANAGGYDPRMANPDYVEYLNMGNEIKAVLTQARTEVREQKAAAAAPKQAVTCPYCGATTTPDASGCCEYCGGSVNG